MVDCFVDRTRLALRGSTSPTLVVAGGVAANAAVRGALTADLDTPAALAAVDAWCAADGDDRDAPGRVRSVVDALLGVAL